MSTWLQGADTHPERACGNPLLMFPSSRPPSWVWFSLASSGCPALACCLAAGPSLPVSAPGCGLVQVLGPLRSHCSGCPREAVIGIGCIREADLPLTSGQQRPGAREVELWIHGLAVPRQGLIRPVARLVSSPVSHLLPLTSWRSQGHEMQECERRDGWTQPRGQAACGGGQTCEGIHASWHSLQSGT